MLTHLSIKNFAVVRSLDIELNDGLTVITGETGAGKSIMVDALGLVLGDRADNNIIRDGTERAEITAVFDVLDNSAATAWLTQQELQPEDCIIRRVLSSDGRSRAFINDRPVTLQQIKELGEALLDIHSQHEHQSLLKKSTHRKLLDSYAGTLALAQQLKELYQSWSDANQQLSLMQQRAQESKEQRELIGYQLSELSSLNLQPDEFEQLESEQARLANAEQILTAGQQILSLCNNHSSDDISTDCSSIISQALRLSEDLRDDNADLDNSIELLQSAKIQIDEAVSSLQLYLSKIEINPEKQQLVEQRLGEAYQLARKHKVHPSELLETQQQLARDFSELENIDDNMHTLAQRIDDARKEYFKLAEELSAARAKAAQQLNQLIIDQMQAMGMPGASFVTQLTAVEPGQLSPYGAENVEFLVSANPGQTPRPLQKVASGGELSRISLAIQVILASSTETPTLIFDEVDVGIGGATAEVVGQLLRTIGSRGQVICVTHQPQVAAKAHHHLYVSKNSVDEHTDSQVAALSREGKVSEVARMLGGIKLTEQTLAHAEEMIAQTTG